MTSRTLKLSGSWGKHIICPNMRDGMRIWSRSLKFKSMKRYLNICCHLYCGRLGHVHCAVTEKTLKCQRSLIKITKCISLFIFFIKYFDYCLFKRRSLKNIRGSLRAKLSHNLQKNSMKGKADYSMLMVSFSWRQFIFCLKCLKINCEKDKKNNHPRHDFKVLFESMELFL